MKRLLTIMILAPMFAGAQILTIPDSLLKIGTVLTFRDTTTIEKTDTIPVMMLMVDTCNPYYTTFKSGYMVQVSRRPNYGVMYLESYGWISRHFLDSRKRRMPLCLFVWDIKPYPAR